MATIIGRAHPLVGVVHLHEKGDRFQEALAVLKRLPVRRYDPATRQWLFPAYLLPRVKERLAELSVDYVESDFPLCGLRRPDVLEREDLKEYQRKGARFLAEAPHGVLLADEMGLGKTVQAILACEAFDADLLVFAPAFLLEKWRQEVERWTGRRVLVFPDEVVSVEAEAVLVSYGQASAGDKGWEAVRRMTLEWRAQRRDRSLCVVFDEVQYLKNRRSRRFKNVLQLVREIEKEAKAPVKRMGLSGTPITRGRPDELLAILEVLGLVDERGNAYSALIRELIFRHLTVWEYNRFAGREVAVGLRPGRDLREFCGLFTLRRTMEEVAGELPDLVRRVVPLPLDEEAFAAVLRKLMRDRRTDDEAEALVEEGLGVHLTTERRALEASKAEHLKEYLRMLAEGGARRIGVFVWHRDVLKEVRKFLEGEGVFRGWRKAFVDGSTSPRARESLVGSLAGSGDPVALAATVGAVNVGMDLDWLEHAVVTGFDWSPATFVQFEGRFRRISSKRSVCVHYLVGKRVELRVLDVLLRKVKALDESFGGFERQARVLAALRRR
ncbi:DEAD/DEAH box helicase [Thermosulfurimonas sp. F29]|uniref:DEAD/DEAH box helicase n=1 Tax=Thermosulfurimonas sp. F29 TaxID=2867247 RepID=UPI001C82E74D|nr:DEAD/DEAH box helicase [Thermosulfurimonas sp. F29]MBX6423442.1 DEAD/DEAH box helicase [Thermosulfurimonas sp. F29]